VSGLFVLAAVGTRLAPAVYGWIALLALAVALPVAALGLAAAAAERATGRVWLSGAQPLQAGERGRRRTAERGGRYASWIWIANGLALWVATLASQLG
jgi:hypothetical protein